MTNVETIRGDTYDPMLNNEKKQTEGREKCLTISRGIYHYSTSFRKNFVGYVVSR